MILACFGFHFRKDDLVTMRFGRFEVAVCCFVTVPFTGFIPVGAVVVIFCGMIMSFRLVIMLVVCMCDGTITRGEDK